MHLLKGFRAVVSSDALRLDIPEEMVREVHLRDVEKLRAIFLYDHISVNQ